MARTLALGRPRHRECGASADRRPHGGPIAPDGDDARAASDVTRPAVAPTARWQIWSLFAFCWASLSALYVGLARALSGYQAFWSPDVGARFGMVRSWVEHSRLVYLNYANTSVDPTGKISPLAGYSVHLPKGVCTVYPPLFPFLSGHAYRAFGFGGLALLPLLGGLGTLLVVHATARRLALPAQPLRPLVLVLIAGLATPALIYSVVYWDHSLQMLLTALAGYGMLRSLEMAPVEGERRARSFRGRAAFALGAGAALGAGVWIHETFLALFLAVVLAGLSLRRLGSVRHSTGLLALGFTPLFLAWAAFNAAVYGAPTGPHFMGPNQLLHPYHLHMALDPAALGDRIVRQLIGAEGATTGVVMLGACLLAYPLCACLGHFSRPRSLRRLGAPALSLLHLALAGAALTAIVGASWVHGLFTATPLLAPALAAPLRSPSSPQVHVETAATGSFYAWLGRACALFMVGVLLSGSSPEMDWGSRYLLTMLPFLFLLAAHVLEGQYRGARRAFRPLVLAGALALVAVSAFSECRAVAAVRGDLAYSRALIDTARAAPSPVLVTDRWWLPPELTAASLPQTQYLAQTPEGLTVLVASLRRTDAADVTYMGSPAGLPALTQALAHGDAPFRRVAAWGGAGLQMARFVRPPAPAPSPVTKRVLALYYPWYGTPAVSGRWMHQEGADPTHKVIADHTHYPVLGPYDSADPAVIERHLQEAKAAGIDTLVCSWWGPKDPTDKAIRLLLRHAPAHGMKVCVQWEQLGATGGVAAAVADLSYLRDTVGQHPAYLRQGGRPVVFVYAGAAQGLSSASGPRRWARFGARTRRARSWSARPAR